MEYAKAFAIALKDHLINNRYDIGRSYTVGGCDTCGYGGTEYFDIDFDKLLEEIDKFSETFKNHE